MTTENEELKEFVEKVSGYRYCKRHPDSLIGFCEKCEKELKIETANLHMFMNGLRTRPVQ